MFSFKSNSAQFQLSLAVLARQPRRCHLLQGSRWNQVLSTEGAQFKDFYQSQQKLCFINIFKKTPSFRNKNVNNFTWWKFAFFKTLSPFLLLFCFVCAGVCRNCKLNYKIICPVFDVVTINEHSMSAQSCKRN